MGDTSSSTPLLTSAGDASSPHDLTSLYCPGCKAHVAYLEVSNKGRIRSSKERRQFRGMAYTNRLVCSEACKIAAMQQ